MPDHVQAEAPEGITHIVIVDGMAVLQSMDVKKLKTFEDLGHALLMVLQKRLLNAAEVHLIFDRYDDESPIPKQAERHKRYGTMHQVFDIVSGRPLPDYAKRLGNNKNKSNLT